METIATLNNTTGALKEDPGPHGNSPRFRAVRSENQAHHHPISGLSSSDQIRWKVPGTFPQGKMYTQEENGKIDRMVTSTL